MKYTIKLLYVRFFGYCGYVNRDTILVWKTIKMLGTDMCMNKKGVNVHVCVAVGENTLISYIHPNTSCNVYCTVCSILFYIYLFICF